MREQYLKDVIEELVKTYPLSERSQQQLYTILTIEGIEEIIQQKDFSPHDFIKRRIIGEREMISTLSPDSVSNIVAVYHTLGDKEKMVDVSSLKSWMGILGDLAILDQLSLHALKEKKTLATEITLQLLPLAIFITEHAVLKREYVAISKKLPQYMNALVEPIEEAARTYFESLFSRCNKQIVQINFFPKTRGDQLGRKMSITYFETENKRPQNITYFIKTHQEGSRSRSSSIKPVDPKELLVYKMLEYIGLGPKVHFFLNVLSQGHLLIATQDVAFTKVDGKIKFFKTYERLKETFEESLKQKNPIEMQTAKGISSTDILSRMFCLYDVTTNPANYGQVITHGTQKQEKWKLIDFRVETRMGSYIIPNIFEGLCQGNGMYNYTGFLGYLMRDRSERERIETAFQVVIDLETGRPRKNGGHIKMPFLEAIDKAFNEIALYVSQNASAFGIDLKATIGELAQVIDEGRLEDYFDQLSLYESSDHEKMGDLGRYVKSVRENFIALAKGVKSKYNALFSSSVVPFSF